MGVGARVGIGVGVIPGVGLGAKVGLGLGVGVGAREGAGVGVIPGVGLGFEVGLGLGVGVGTRVGVGVGVGVGDGASLTATGCDVPLIDEVTVSVTKIVWEPGVLKVTEKAPVPSRRKLSAGRTADPSELVKWTVPEYPLTGLL